MAVSPVYPYAFIQVPALAKQSGIRVLCKDLLGIPAKRWEQTIRSLIQCFDPNMILITLRNTDSLTAEDYEKETPKDEEEHHYFPIEKTKALVSSIRAVSDRSIALGGFGFSVLPAEIMDYVRPDFGVFGGANAFFEHFEDIEAGKLQDVANLLYFQGDRLISNPRVFFPPLDDTEYTDHVIEEMIDFYTSFPSPGFKGAPVEIMRGCCHSCVFCSEPKVLGRRVRYRDLSVVMEDIEILIDHGINQIYMISSELNPEGNEFVLQLADMIRSFNECQPEGRKITWYGANYLLNFTTKEWEQLHISGFTGGWFEITALDDRNARAMRTPYRNESLLVHLENYADFHKKRVGLLPAPNTVQPETPESRIAGIPKVKSPEWTLFLGNPATTVDTIRKTLLDADREGLARFFGNCTVNTHIRVFDYEEPDEFTRAATYSVSTDLERVVYDQLLPSFAYPPALLRTFGSEEEIRLMFDHIAQTYLSTRYQETRDWDGFVKRRSTVESVDNWLTKLSETEGVCGSSCLSPQTELIATSNVQRLFAGRVREGEDLAKRTVDLLLSVSLQTFPEFFASLGLPKTQEELDHTTSYQLAAAVFARWETEKCFFDEVTLQTRCFVPGWIRDLLEFCACAILYKFDISVRRQYRRLFMSDRSIEKG